MSNFDKNNNVSRTNDIHELLGGLKASVKYHEDSSDKDIIKMVNLLNEAYKTIEFLSNELNVAKNKNKIPTKDEVESISAMLDLVNKLDPITINKLNSFGEYKK